MFGIFTPGLTKDLREEWCDYENYVDTHGGGIRITNYVKSNTPVGIPTNIASRFHVLINQKLVYPEKDYVVKHGYLEFNLALVSGDLIGLLPY